MSVRGQKIQALEKLEAIKLFKGRSYKAYGKRRACV
jgi:hypothetical protein